MNNIKPKIPSKLKTKDGRKQALDSMTSLMEFSNKIVIIGKGSIGSAIIPLILKLIKIPQNNIIIIEKNKERLATLLTTFPLIQTYNIELTKINTMNILIDLIKLKQDDIIIDSSYKISTKYMFDLCSLYGISYVNSSVELWSYEEDPDTYNNPQNMTYYSIIKEIEEANKLVTNKKNNFIIGSGCNPGNVNVWVMYALEKINNNRFQYTSYADLAYKLGLQTIHISEKDSQITNNPKKFNEYVNTWSTDAISWYGEAFTNPEIGWGTHEVKLPKDVNLKMSNEYQIVLDSIGAFTWANTYTPIHTNLLGMMIPHEECYTICKKLTIQNALNNIIYKPSCYYIYRPCDSSLASTIEVGDETDIKEYYNEVQPNVRLMTSDITEGRDELGCTLFFSNGDVYWIGSLLDINEARDLYDNSYNDIVNATNVQVIAGYIGSLLHIIQFIKQSKYMGLLHPHDLPIKQFIKWTRPLLGPFGLMKVTDWGLVNNMTNKTWQFNDFIE